MSEQSQELELRTHRTVDLRSAATDSWTDVLEDVVSLARGVANTEFVPTSLRGSVDKVTAAILYGRELGLPPMTGLGSTHVIEGKAGISAELMRALISQAGHELHIVSSTRTECRIRGRRKGSDNWTEVSFTYQEAAEIRFKSKEGWKSLVTKTNWQNFPADMLVARATTRLARMVFPDVIHGMRSVEELDDQVESVTDEAAPAATSRTVKRAAKPAKAEPAPEPAEPQARNTAPAPTVAAPPAQEAPARTRVAPPAPKPSEPATAPAKGEEPVEAEVVDEPTLIDQQSDDEPETVEAVVVDDAADAEPVEATVVTAPSDEPRVTPRFLAVIQQQFKRIGVDDRDERLFWCWQIVGRKVDTSKDLTAGEGKTLAQALEKLRDRDALEALGKQIGGES